MKTKTYSKVGGKQGRPSYRSASPLRYQKQVANQRVKRQGAHKTSLYPAKSDRD